MNEGHSRGSGAPHRVPARSSATFDGDRACAELKRFLDSFVPASGLELTYAISSQVASGDLGQGEEILVSFEGPDQGLLLERNAELLLALEHIAHRWLRLDPSLHDRVRLDCGDFRATRLEELKLSARVAAQRVRETGQPFRFNPMSSRERRVIHLELNSASDVRTVSEGSGDRRQLVIYPASRKPHP